MGSTWQPLSQSISVTEPGQRAEPLRTPAEPGLSAVLRMETTGLHAWAEEQLGLPGSIRDLDDYRLCLVRFYRLYRPLEAVLAGFEEWASAGLTLESRWKEPDLDRDLRALSVDPGLQPDAPSAALPALPTFAHALGALYVLEGSTLGSRMILSRLEFALGRQIHGAAAFFTGRGERTGESWKELRRCLDGYGETHAGAIAAVVEGAAATFRAVGDWMRHDGDR